jgi:hypothetical protein
MVTPRRRAEGGAYLRRVRRVTDTQQTLGS